MKDEKKNKKEEEKKKAKKVKKDEEIVSDSDAEKLEGGAADKTQTDAQDQVPGDGSTLGNCC